MKKHYKLLTIFAAFALLMSSCSVSLGPSSYSRRSRKSSSSEESSLPGSSSSSESSSEESSSQPTVYTITWKNYDGEVLKEDSVIEGDMPAYNGEDPHRDSDAQYDYTFSGWTPEVGPATGNREYTATYDTEVRRYTVVWKNYDDTIIETDENVPYGTTPHFDGDTPTRQSSVSTVYTFDGWSPEVNDVTGNVAYTAVFKEEVRQYTITWKNYDGTILKEEKVDYGVVPTYTGEAPQKESDVQYNYAFSGWSPSLVAVEGDTEYTAEFETEVRKYTITWKNYDGSTIKTEEVAYGTLPVYSGEDPAKEPTAQYVYVFSGWSPTIIPVEGNAEYIAQFDSETRTYTVTWKNYDGTILEVDENVPYGTTPTFDGENPTRANVHGIKYAFTGWDQTPVPIWCDMTFTAQFSTTPFFQFDTIPYELENGYRLSDIKGAPWINSNISGELNKIKKPSLKDDFYTYVNYDSIRYGNGNGPFQVSSIETRNALNKMFNTTNGTTNIDYFYSFAEKLGSGDAANIANYLELVGLNIDQYLASKEMFVSSSSLLKLMPYEDGYEVQYNDGYIFGTTGIHSLMFFSYFSNYRSLESQIIDITNVLYSELGLDLSDDEYDEMLDLERSNTYGVYSYYDYYGKGDASEYTVETLPADIGNLQSSLLDLGLEPTDKIVIRDCVYDQICSIYYPYYRDTIKNMILTRLAFDYRFFVGSNNYRTINQYLTQTGFFANENNLYNYTGMNLSLEMAAVALQSITEQMYIELSSTEQTKAKVAQLIEDVLQGYKDLVDDMDWLSNTTKEGIRRKLDNMAHTSCYADAYKNFPRLSTTNVGSTPLFEYYQRYVNAVTNIIANGQAEDNDKWKQMPSYTVNAYYSALTNEFVILNGIVSGFLSDNVEEFYGMLGFVIGHEITHAFDSSGSQYDEYGSRRDWWASADKNKFNSKVTKMINFYGKIDQFDNHFVDGDLVDGEATADMGGIRVMLKLAESIPDFDYDLFFRTCAYTWCTPTSDLSYMNYRIGDSHPLNYLRTNVTLAQFDKFVETYDIGPGDGMYIPPSERVAIW